MHTRAILLALLLWSWFQPATDAASDVVVIYGSTTFISRFLEPGAASLEKATNIQLRTVGVGTGQGLFALLQGQTKVSAAFEDLQAAIESAKKYAVSKSVVPGSFDYLRIINNRC